MCPAMICRVCLLKVKKSAVLCAQCSLIAHSKCAVNAPPTCDLRAQLLQYAQYADKGLPGSAYSNPLDALSDFSARDVPGPPMSDVAYVAHTRTPRSSIDGSVQPSVSPPIVPGHPPIAFKFPNPFKRSRAMTPEPAQTSTSLPPPALPPKDEKVRANKLRRNAYPTKERPSSVVSDGTAPNSSSLRSAGTNSGSYSGSGRLNDDRANPAPNSGRQTSMSPLSIMNDSDAPRSSRLTFGSASVGAVDEDEDNSVPGSMPTDTRRQKTRDAKLSDKGCIMQ
jgi:hypothetical protein